ncbi:putative Serine/threonine-protein kinase SNT7 [Monoraphidium neglectum]|uniref:Putative Serine/threonine-protein kinase SNT7 n=1 Tax=Monoraphidium neglectum TaxID=145388 RepID=A0A0D2LM50_9CHLO|nr:putative Serine/threonine-protein kinase SNT7 [Monoraphidium neglectum]KIZ07424.1 putative Serine/threonine-protein kinase SNT7 [Monoraphidium neglectum]|eukprot:XP_013906443.1 putative Serine/threonine-protein kinase SNT7 [Monoraphidium neglectum]
MGQGAYSTVFEGLMDLDGVQERVVLKRVKQGVEGAEEMVEMEALMNINASKGTARGAVAAFLGYCWVEPRDAAGELTPGLWLVWRYEGSNTLASYLNRRDGLDALAADLGVAPSDVIQTATGQILSALAELHAAGLVHRDLKPANIILAEAERRLKLIDLGGCADLRSGTNYVPGECIYDPLYCPPELYVLPTAGPHIAKSLLAQATSSMLWARHKPDRYDCWSAGITLLCLAVPTLRNDAALLRFQQELEAADYELDAWRASSRFVKPTDFAALDADGGAGWELARDLLRPRDIVVAADGAVDFVASSEVRRISAADALKHRFLERVFAPEPQRAAGSPKEQRVAPGPHLSDLPASPSPEPGANPAGVSGGGTGRRRVGGAGQGLLRGLKGALLGRPAGRPHPGMRATGHGDRD